MKVTDIVDIPIKLSEHFEYDDTDYDGTFEPIEILFNDDGPVRVIYKLKWLDMTGWQEVYAQYTKTSRVVKWAVEPNLYPHKKAKVYLVNRNKETIPSSATIYSDVFGLSLHEDNREVTSETLQEFLRLKDKHWHILLVVEI